MALLHRFHHPTSPQVVLRERRVPREKEAAADAIAKLCQTRLLVPDACPTPGRVEATRMLIAWLQVTQACNLQCAYCYVHTAPEHMSPDVGRRAVDAIFRSAVAQNKDRVRLKFAGGEPTLAFPAVVQLHRRATRFANERAIELDSVVISNGFGLTDSMLETIRALGLRLTISLDGLGAYHDCQRHLADGTGTFKAVIDTIDRALDVGLMPGISVTITARSLPGVPGLIEWLLRRELPFGLDFYRDNALSAHRTDLQLDRKRTIETMRKAFHVIENRLPRHSLLTALLDRTNLAWPHCRTCSVGSNYLVIDTQGRVAKCQMDMQHVVTDVDARDPLAALQGDCTGIQNLPVDTKDGCRVCEWRHWCAGGCPLDTYRATGRWDTRSPYCSIYKALFPEVLRLEGRRLLTYGQPSA